MASVDSSYLEIYGGGHTKFGEIIPEFSMGLQSI
jgi:hypothetical protein